MKRGQYSVNQVEKQIPIKSGANTKHNQPGKSYPIYSNHYEKYQPQEIKIESYYQGSPQYKKYTKQNVSQNQRSEPVWKVKLEEAEKEIFQKCQQIQRLEQYVLALEQNQNKRQSQELEKYSKFLDECSQAYSAQNIKLQKQNQSYKQREKQYQKQTQSSKEREKQYQKRISDLEGTLEKLLIEEKAQKKSEPKEVELYDVLLAKGISDITVQILKSQEIHTLEELKELKQEDLRALGLKLGEIVRIRKLQ